MFQYLTARIRARFSSGDLDRDLNHELDSHISMAVEEHVRNGMTEEQALRKARIELGGATQLQEAHRETRGLPFLDTLIQDLRYTFRTLRRDAGFTTFAILIAGLGIGASATIFSVVNAVMLRPLPFRDASRLAWVGNIADDGVSEWRLQVDHVLDLKDQTASFSEMAGYFAYSGVGDNKLTAEGEPIRLTGISVSCGFFPLFGVQPVAGRLFTKQECATFGGGVLISHSLWTRRYNSDPNIVGRPLTVNESPVTVIGVMPESFDFAAVFAPGNRTDLYFPFPLNEQTNRWGNSLAVVGRLKPGVTIESAQAEFTVLARNIVKEHPARNSLRPVLMSLDRHVNGRFRPALLVLAGAVGVVMLIVCANLANLQLARASARQKEMAIRVALGAGRRRLIRQLLTESLVLAVCGAVPGLLLAVAGTRLFAHLETFNIPMLSSVRIDSTSLAFTAATALLSGLLFGLVAALQAPLLDVHETLKDSSRSATGGRRHTWIRATLVVSEIAFACVLLVGTGLLVRSFLHVLDTDLGFRPERAAALRIDPAGTTERQNAYVKEVLRVVRSIPGINSAAVTDILPFSANERSWAVGVKGRQVPAGSLPETFVRVVTDGCLNTAGIRLVAGRDLTERDRPETEKVALVNETLARTLFPGENALGQMLDSDGGRRIVGIVADTRHRAIEEKSGSEIYFPMRQTGYATADLIVRTSLPPAELAAAVRKALKPIDSTVVANEFRTLQQLVDKAVSPRRFVVWLLAGFSGFALILAALGIYALISYSVNQRTQEFGIRMALGASAGELQRAVLGQTLTLAGVGVVIGMAASWVLGRSLTGLLFGVESGDPVTFILMVVILGAAAAIAGYVPARTASRIDPMVALRGV